MSDLKQELERLATRAPSSTPPQGLWSRGLRRHRRRRAAAVAGAMLVAVSVGTLAGVGAQSVRGASVPVAGSDAVAAIPSRVDEPSPWLPAVDATSPTGPLALVVGAERKSLFGGSTVGLVGVSARTGAYRFLDLPDQADEAVSDGASDVVLSPDGRWVAYWKGGRVSRSSGSTGVVAAAAYDTRTGSVRALPLTSRLGAMPSSLEWVDDDRLLVGWSAVTSRSAGQESGRVQPTRLWDLSGVDREVSHRLSDLSGFRRTPGGFSASDGTAVELMDDDLRVVERHPLRLTEDQYPLGTVSVSSEGTVALVVADGGRNGLLTGRLLTDRRSGSGRGPETLPVDLGAAAVGPLVPEGVLAARDARHLLVLGHVGSAQRGVYAVDTSTGRSERLVTVPNQIFGADIQFASELWDRPPVARPGAPWTPDPRWVAVGVGFVVLVGVAWWRRRRGLV